MENDVDVLVVGAGVGGLTVAAELALRGREVGVIELSSAIGGSAALSEGFVWTNPDLESFRRQDPGGDGDKFLAMSAELDAAMSAVRERGIEVGPRLTEVLGYGEGNQIDIHGYIASCRRLVERSGWVLFAHQASSLIVEDDRVVGARIRDLGSGEESDLRAGAVVLATGGFQGSPALRSRYIGPWAEDIVLRANPHSAGAGLELGLAAGAATSGEMGGFYGHLIPRPVENWVGERFTPLSQYYSEHGVLLDARGRLVGTEGDGDHILVQDVARIGRALLFIDQQVWEKHARKAFIPGMLPDDKVLDARAAGGHVSTGDDLAALVAPVAEWGYDAEAVLATLRAVQDGSAGRASRLTEPPFALLEVQPAITFTLGGLRTDVDGRVLREDGSPVDGLYAAGVDAGGVNVRGYTGGIVRGLTLGRVAARAIDDEIS